MLQIYRKSSIFIREGGTIFSHLLLMPYLCAVFEMLIFLSSKRSYLYDENIALLLNYDLYDTAVEFVARKDVQSYIHEIVSREYLFIPTEP